MTSRCKYRYLVTVEVYNGDEYVGTKKYKVTAHHCAVAAQKVEAATGHSVIGAERLYKIV